MKNILIIGSTGQIGSELTMKLRGIYTGNVVAGYIPGAEPKGELLTPPRLAPLLTSTTLTQFITLLPC